MAETPPPQNNIRRDKVRRVLYRVQCVRTDRIHFTLYTFYGVTVAIQ